jgi:dTDP-4-amino-4,6-dideoxy-D-galactose acyltransferase
MEKLEKAILHRRDKLLYYSPYNFLRHKPEEQIDKIVIPRFSGKNIEIIAIKDEVFFIIEYLEWDSQYFGVDTYKLICVLYYQPDFQLIDNAIQEFIQLFFHQGKKKYCFTEIPSEDVFIVQGLSKNGFRLVETRLTYYNDAVQKFDNKRFEVSTADVLHIENLSYTAQIARNEYDRLHADFYFSAQIADDYLATYVAESIRGFADVVMIPSNYGNEPFAFLTAKHCKGIEEIMGEKISKMVLSAVAPQRKGWYYKLISEMTYHFKELGVTTAFMNTQSTNRAVFRTWEKLGYNLGSTSHILVYST